MITLEQKELHFALKELARVADTNKSSMPVLGSVLISSRGRDLYLTTTDATQFLAYKMQCISDEDFSATIPVKSLLEITKPEKNQDHYFVDISWENQEVCKIRVCVDGLVSIIYGVPSCDFPEFPDKDWEFSGTAETKKFKSTLDYILAGTSTDEGRPHLNGIYFESSGENDVIVSTDGHRLHRAPNCIHGTMPEYLVSRNSILILNRLLKYGEFCDVSLDGGVNYIRFQVDNWALDTKNVDARFPPYEKVIPSTPRNNRAFVHQKDLFKALTKIMRTTKSKAVTIELNGEFRLSATNNELDFTVEATVKSIHNGDDITFGVNPQYLLDILDKKSDLAIEMTFDGPGDAIVAIHQRQSLNNHANATLDER